MNQQHDAHGHDASRHDPDGHDLGATRARPSGASSGCGRQGGSGRVWLTAQRSPRAQRAGLFTAESITHPARMGPDLAAHIVARYTRPGDWVLDPMCGIGTTVVQAVRHGRRAVGVEYEPRWLDLATANLALARDAGHGSAAHLVRGDARRLRALLPGEVAGQVALVLTSPPYGRGVHGHLTNRNNPARSAACGSGRIVKRHHRYAPSSGDRANLAHATRSGLADGMTAILTEAAAVLRPGGVVVLVVRPWREDGALVDLPEQMITSARQAGLVLVDRAAALHGRIDETTGQLVARQSFFQSVNVARSRATGAPTHLIAHECVLVLGVEQAASSNSVNDNGVRQNGVRQNGVRQNGVRDDGVGGLFGESR